MEKDRLIQKHLASDLSEAENILFQKLLETDPSFQADVEFAEDLHFVSREEKAIELKQMLQQEESQINTKKGKSWKWLLLLSGIILLLIIYFFIEYRSHQPQQLYAKYYERPINTYLPITRASQGKTTVERAFIAYEQNENEIAIKEFRQLNEEAQNPNVIFYYAILLAENDQLEQAIKTLEQLLLTQQDVHKEVYWYLGLFYVKNNQKSKALEILDVYKQKDLNERETERLLNLLNQL